MENEQTNIIGKQGNQNQITNNISDLETDQKVADTKSMGLISDAEMKDFEAKFGGFTLDFLTFGIRASALMNGTLTWSNATKAVLADIAICLANSYQRVARMAKNPPLSWLVNLVSLVLKQRPRLPAKRLKREQRSQVRQHVPVLQLRVV